MKLSKGFLKVWAACSAVLLVVLVAINLTADPVWFTPWDHRLNAFQPTHDERRQKSSYLKFRVREGAYSGVLFGSSRATFLPPSAFEGEAVFNYGVSAVQPEEIPDYLRYFEEHAGSPKKVYLCMDFEGVLRQSGPVRHPGPEVYFAALEDPWFRPKHLLSGDNLDASQKVFTLSLDAEARAEQRAYYDRRLDKYLRTVTDEERRKHFQRQLPGFEEELRAPLRDDYRQILAAIREAAAGAELVVFTSPISADYFRLLGQERSFRVYEMFLRELVAEFGEVTDFMGLTEFTLDRENYYDAHHFDEVAGRRLVKDLLAAELELGVRVVEATLTSHLHRQKQSLAIDRAAQPGGY